MQSYEDVFSRDFSLLRFPLVRFQVDFPVLKSFQQRPWEERDGGWGEERERERKAERDKEKKKSDRVRKGGRENVSRRGDRHTLTQPNHKPNRLILTEKVREMIRKVMLMPQFEA
jgi:hypothetical protein